MLECAVFHEDSPGLGRGHAQDQFFPILRDFYHLKVVKDSDQIINYDIKFDFPTRPTNKGIHIIEVGLWQ